MSEETTLKAERREGTGKGVARKLRAAGKLPAVVYGGGDGNTDHISLDAHDAEYLFRNISVDNTIVDIDIEGEKEPVQTLVREIQMHPWKATLVHVDFLRIQKGVAVEMDVPLNLVGTPKGVQLDGGVIEQIIHDLAIRCIPSKIPETIEVDISAMELNDVMHISDITVDEGIEIMIAPERTICSVSQPRAVAADEASEDEEGEVGAVAEAADGDPEAGEGEG
jgi:large subunit ribosomal protein L25